MVLKNVSMLIAPALLGEDLWRVFQDAGFLVLDALLDQGRAGVVFRRMKLAAALRPELRAQYDVLRDAYLRQVLPPVLAGQRGVVLVGSRPTDVDLCEFEVVDMLSVSDATLEALSCKVYGEPHMLALEYAHVRSIVSDSIDSYYDVADWSHLSFVLSRNYDLSMTSFGLITDDMRNRILVQIWRARGVSEVWLEDKVVAPDEHIPAPVMIYYDYLGAILPEWRDAVVRSLSLTPTLREFFLLPWYVVDPAQLHLLCYRLDLRGSMAVSLQGESLIDLIRGKLSGHFTASELVGTWVGALLCDRVTVLQAVRRLDGKVIIPTTDYERPGARVRSEEEYSRFKLDKSTAVRVPLELLWMYDACQGVYGYEWDGPRDDRGRIVVGASDVDRWAVTIRMASVLTDCYDDPIRRAEVVAFVRRVHLLGRNGVTLADMFYNIYARIEAHDDLLPGDMDLLPMMPGALYLRVVPKVSRGGVFASLGMYPEHEHCVDYVRRMGSVSEGGTEELWFTVARAAIMSGSTVNGKDLRQLVVGHNGVSNIDDGYCYLKLYRPEYWSKYRRSLGPYPSLIDVWCADSTHRIDKYQDRLWVDVKWDEGGGALIHFSLESGQYRHREFQDMVRKRMVDIEMDEMLVGAVITQGSTDGGDLGTVPQAQYDVWHTLAIVTTTICCVALLVAIAWYAFVCRRGKQVGRRR